MEVGENGLNDKRLKQRYCFREGLISRRNHTQGVIFGPLVLGKLEYGLVTENVLIWVFK
jgi:hypothetical protein